MHDFRLPSLGADMETGVIVEWKIGPGEAFKRGDVILVVETEKAVIDVEIWESGVLDEILATPGTRVPVGTPIARLHAAGESETAVAPRTEPEVVASVPAPPPVAPPPPSPRVTAGGHRVRVTPVARRLAEQLGVQVEAVHGTGPEGAITRADVERAAAAKTAPPAVDRHAAMRRGIAAAMSKAKREIPHYYLASTFEVSTLLTWLAARNASRPPEGRLLLTVPLLKAVALATRTVPEMNGHWLDDEFHPSPAVHCGIAIAIHGGGLIAPAIHSVESKNLDQVMGELRDIVRRARDLNLRSSEIADGTITVSALGDEGSDALYGIIYPPQVALVGFGAVRQRPWVDAEGGIVVRPVMMVTLAADHRASDGRRGSLFLETIGRLLAQPEKLEDA